MNTHHAYRPIVAILGVSLFLSTAAIAQEPAAQEPVAKEPAVQKTAERPSVWVDGVGPGWKELGEDDFVNVNCAKDTWSFKDGSIHCTGKPIGVMRSAKQYTNFELVTYWKHLKHAGNSGIFVWSPKTAIEALKLPKARPLPHGIEVQILDLGYEERYEKRHGKKSNWFTSHGDIFAVGDSKMKPFPPLSANGGRSFPSKNTTKPAGEWNHYYIRCINGEVRLWVNGEEVSGGNGCEPSSGYLAIESEGSPIEFKKFRVRELP